MPALSTIRDRRARPASFLPKRWLVFRPRLVRREEERERASKKLDQVSVKFLDTVVFAFKMLDTAVHGKPLDSASPRIQELRRTSWSVHSRVVTSSHNEARAEWKWMVHSPERRLGTGLPAHPSGSRMRVSRILGLAVVAAAILARPAVTPHSVIVEFNGESARSLSARYKAAVVEVQDPVYKTRKRYRGIWLNVLGTMCYLCLRSGQREGWLRGKDLNLRPLGYEPNELPDCSTPQNYGNVPGRSRQFSPLRVVIPWRECESSCEKSTCMWVYSALPAWSFSA